MIPEPELLSDDRIERRSNSTICQEHDRLCDPNAGCRSFLRKLREGSPEPMQGVDVTRGRKKPDRSRRDHPEPSEAALPHRSIARCKGVHAMPLPWVASWARVGSHSNFGGWRRTWRPDWVLQPRANPP